MNSEQQYCSPRRQKFEEWYRSRWTTPISETELQWSLRWNGAKKRYSDSAIDLAWSAWDAASVLTQTGKEKVTMSEKAASPAPCASVCSSAVCDSIIHRINEAYDKLKPLMDGRDTAMAGIAIAEGLGLMLARTIVERVKSESESVG